MPFNQTGPNAQANINTYYDVAGNQTINNTFNQTTDTKELEKKQSIINHPWAQASQKDYQIEKKTGPCFEGTRVVLLQEMKGWTAHPGESKIYILSGLAGIGKSTVAYTVAEWADASGCHLLGASFFFSRDDAERNNAKRFFTTLAYQLYHYSEEFARAIGDVLITKRGSTAISKSPREQLDALILEPLGGVVVPSDRPILIVVDALDECDDDDTPSVLEGLRRIVQDLPSFKIILTTRPQPLSNDFASIRGHKIFHLQDIEDKVVNDDIRLYLKHSLSWEQVKEHLPGLRRKWCASDHDIESLVQAAGKLFIIASTAILFVLDKGVRDPEGRMSELVRTLGQDRTPFNVLNNFYHAILRKAVREDCDNDIVKRYQSVVGSIMVIQTPLSIASLAFLTGTREEQIEGVLDNLQSVILIGDNHVPRVYHKSFVDYIIDSKRCEDTNLRIDLTDRHTWIATQCFEIMNKHLKYNILGLDSPGRFMDNKKGLAHQGISDEDLQEKIPPGLRYACMYWANHLESANIEDAGLVKVLGKFADDHMLPWFEALSLIRKLDSAPHSVLVALRVMKPTSSNLFRLLSDGLRFISKFYELIRTSALHTYYSALPFTPRESLLYRQYSKAAVNGVCWTMDGPKNWGALIAILDHGNKNRNYQVTFSPDSTMFASWNSESMKFWDAVTGTPISTIPLNSDHIAITNDFSTVASAEGNAITLYSTKRGTPVATFTASGRIEGLALSSEGSRVAACFSGANTCLWDIKSGELIASFDDQCTAVAFCPTGARLLCRRDGIMNLRDGTNGVVIASLGDQNASDYEPVFSHDGSRFAFITRQSILKLFKSEDGQLVGVTKVSGLDLVISANGSLLASGNWSDVKLWSGNSGDPLLLIDKVDLGSLLHSLAFSLNDMLAIATYSNIMLYDVRNHTFISILPLPFQGAALTFSPNCTRLTFLSDHGKMCLWDVPSMKGSSSTNELIRPVALSQDGACLAYVFENNAIELWEIGLTRRRIAIHYRRHPREVFRFSPDGKKIAAAVSEKTVELWDTENGASIGSVEHSSGIEGLSMSKHMLAIGSWTVISLWDLRTLQLNGTILTSGADRLSFSDDSGLLAAYGLRRVTVFDVIKRTAIATFDPSDPIFNVAFLPDSSHIIVQSENGRFHSFNLGSKEVIEKPMVNHLIQLRHFTFSNEIPVWPRGERHDRHWKNLSLVGLFSQLEDPVPVLWFPTDLRIKKWFRGPSMIILDCDNGQPVFVQTSSSAVSNFSLFADPVCTTRVDEETWKKREGHGWKGKVKVLLGSWKRG